MESYPTAALECDQCTELRLKNVSFFLKTCNIEDSFLKHVLKTVLIENYSIIFKQVIVETLHGAAGW